MTYFKFTDQNNEILYCSINVERESIDLEKLKGLLHAKTLEEVTKEEYDEQDGEVDE